MISSSVILATTGFIGAIVFARARAVLDQVELPRDRQRLDTRKPRDFALALQRFAVTRRARCRFSPALRPWRCCPAAHRR